MQIRRLLMLAAVLVLILGVGACAKKKPPVARPAPPPPSSGTNANRPPTPPEPVTEPQPIPPEPVAAEDTLAARDIDDINRNSPFQPVFFVYGKKGYTHLLSRKREVERWFHEFGCRRWSTIRRDTRTDAVLE